MWVDHISELKKNMLGRLGGNDVDMLGRTGGQNQGQVSWEEMEMENLNKRRDREETKIISMRQGEG